MNNKEKQSTFTAESRNADCPYCESSRKAGGNYCRRCGQILKDIRLIPPEYQPGRWREGRSS